MEKLEKEKEIEVEVEVEVEAEAVMEKTEAASREGDKNNTPGEAEQAAVPEPVKEDPEGPVPAEEERGSAGGAVPEEGGKESPAPAKTMPAGPAEKKKAAAGPGGTAGLQGSPDPTDKKGEDPKHRRAFWVSLLAVLAILAAVYGAGWHYCSRHFMPGTRINDYDCGGMTVEEAEEVFAGAADNYVLNIRFRGGATEMLSASDLGFAYQADGSIDRILQGQDRMLWPRYLFEDWSYEIRPGGTYDADRLEESLQRLPELQKENMEAPKDAYITFRSGDEDKDGTFVIVPDTEGSTIDLTQLTAGVGDAASRYAEIVDAGEIDGAYVAAQLRADNAGLIARCKDLNEIVGASITYVLPDGDTIRLNSDVMKDWLVRDKSGKLVRDDEVWDEKLWEFLEKLAVNSNTLGMDRRFHSTLRGTITVSGGDYGYMVNQITEHDKLVKDLAEQKKETRRPDYYISPYNEETENDGIGTTYIEADLSAQHIWCYVNGQMVMESDCVSGDTTDGHGTPTGVFGIMFMKKDTVLEGAMQSNGKREYETRVGYWMPFYSDCGFHDAWWRTAFGGTIYQGDGSHGCINLPVNAAETLWSYCDTGMPVVVYY